MTIKNPQHLKREANLIQMLDPMASWCASLPASEQHATTTPLAGLDFSRLGDLFENFLQVLGVPIALLDLQGKVLASSRWQRACVQFHRQADNTAKSCKDSDNSLIQQLKQGKEYAICRCPNGLTDCATAIMVESEHVATLFIGQFFLQAPEQSEIIKQAQAAGFDTDDYLAAIEEVAIIEQSKLPALLALLTALARQFTELSLANNRYQRSLQYTEQQVALRTQELLLQNQILSQISEGADVKTILHNLVSQVELLHPDMLCSVLLLDDDGETLRHGAAPSLPEAYNKALDGLKIGMGVGSCGTAAFSGDTVIVPDIHTHPYWQPYQALAKLANVQSCWSQPIKNARGKVLGTFAIYQQQSAEPSAELLQKMKSYGNLAELAISRSQSAAKIRRLAFYDSLTGLANRSLLEQLVIQAIASSERSGQYCGLMFIDLDNFKPVNDSFGHKAGDKMLVDVARRLLDSVRAADTVARFGGDEFIVLLRDIDNDSSRSKRHMQQIADKICHALSQPYTVSEHLIHQSSCSIGMVLFQGESSCDELLRQADSAMYQAKRERLHRACWYDGARC